MKTCLYVFTGTGTSLAIANKIGNFLGDTQIKLIPDVLKNAMEHEIMVEAPVVGFIFPNHFGGIPNMVSRLIQILNLDQTKYIFAIVSAGGSQGYSLKFLEKELQNKGKKLNYGKCIAGTSNYIVAWYYKLFCKTGEQRVHVLKQLEEKTKCYANDIACQKEEVAKSQFISYKLSRILSPKSIVQDPRQWDKEFSVDENCIGCRTCEQVCQVKNIQMKNNKPDFQHHCQRCMACFQYCPRNAIGIKGKTLVKPRYFHPDYPSKALIRFIRDNNKIK